MKTRYQNLELRSVRRNGRPIAISSGGALRGFTLIELLVVISIIGLLMALLLPAVNGVRETARRASCLNNIQQLSTAVRMYDGLHHEFPGYVNVVGKSSNNNTPGTLGTWAVMVLPGLDRADVYEKFFVPDPATTSLPTNSSLPTISSFMCPSDLPEDQSVNPTALSYVANCGIPDDPTSYSSVTIGNSVTASGAITITDNLVPPGAYRTNGMFFDHYSPRYNGIITGVNVPNITSGSDHIPDGSSYTLMVAENFMPTSKDIGYGFKYREYYPPISQLSTSINTPYPQPPLTTPTVGNISKAVIDFEKTVGFVWDPQVPDQTTPSDPRRINGDVNRKLASTSATPKSYSPLTATTSYYYVRPSSSHSGGVNVAMCGGNCFFLRQDIDYWVYEQLMTPDHKHSQAGIPSTSFNAGYILDDNDYK